ncbi:G surface protein, allelic form 156 like [Actinidia chinensis var. chinensis]|uniref:G surface protein, allelic form 156 like n=1 Tax=Actinidia chinensis var. chinensis TaxID=1590841 RepID=A0A2R6PW69_ACTCC|nr:G surface protein, allelic form 156 like [Actinidia chinensis var. chinensis]
MGAKEVLAFLMVSFHFCYSASLFPQGKNLPSAHLQEKAGEIETGELKTSTHHGGENGIAHRSNFDAGGRGGSHGRGKSGSGADGNGGTYASPKTAGTAVIPLYAAGAAGSHRNHRGAASCNRSSIGLPTLCAVILASLIVHIYIVLESKA